jgi:hypothetical protein
MADKNIYWSKTGLTGGAATDLDSIDGTGLQDGEIAHVWISNVLYIYLLDVDSGAAESSPAIIAPDTNAGDKRWILQSYYSGSGTLYTDHIAESTAAHGVEIDGLTIKDSGFAIGSDADGDMYYRASSALARLAKGTANYKLFMNAAGTAPEWARGQAKPNIAVPLESATGDVNYTIGFVPSVLIVLTSIAGTFMHSIGVYAGGTSYCLYATAAGIVWPSEGNIAYLYYESGKYKVASVKTLGSTTVLTWTLTGTGLPDVDIYGTILAFR